MTPSKIINTLMLLIAAPFIVLIGMAIVLVTTVTATYTQILRAWR